MKKAAETTTPFPAYFLSLEVENFRCFGPRQKLDLSNGNGGPAQWTIILGENGVGKTSLLQCLNGIQPEPLSLEGANGIKYELWNPLSRNNLLLRRVFNPLIHKVNAESPFFISWKIFTGKNFNVPPDKENIVFLHCQNSGSGAAILGTRKDLRGFTLFAYGASRRMGTTSLADLNTENTNVSLFSDDVELINAEEWLLQADYAANRLSGDNQIRAEKRRDTIKTVLIELLPDVSDIRYVDSDDFVSKTSVEVETPYGWVPINDLSLGYRSLLTWMVDFAARMFEQYPESPDPLAEPAIVLVDEIDLHLHPRWQRTIVDFLSKTFRNTQFIVTAHSPLVVQSATDANIVLLRREGDHVVIDNDVETIRNWRVDQILTSDLFGLESARPPQIETAMGERKQILSKSHLTKADEERVAQLEKEIGPLPTGETQEDIKAMEIIRQAANRLKGHQEKVDETAITPG